MIRNKRGRSPIATAVAATLAGVLVPPAAAGGPPPKILPSADTGRALAERLCGGCHLVEGAPAPSVPAGIPSLRGLANKPGQSGRRIENALISPHAPMPDMRLSQAEIAHLLAYLETLRTNPAVPPLVGEPDPEKPVYPKPS